MSITLTARLRLSRPGVYMHWCAGCKSRHFINVGEPNASGAAWKFNGDIHRPTFSPSVHIQIGPYTDERNVEHPKRTQCHYFITDGRIEYCGDSAHDLKGQTLELPVFPEGRS